MKERINVLTVGYHACGRLVKEYVALLINNVQGALLTKLVTDEDLLYRTGGTNFYNDRGDLFRKLSAVTDHIHVVHYHNEPNWPALVIREAMPDVALVVDCHDLQSMRTGVVDKEEAEMIRTADGLIFPSQGYLDRCKSLFDIDDETPMAVVYSMCNRSDVLRLQTVTAPRLPGIVYEGGSIAKLDDFDVPEHTAYRDYTHLAVELYKNSIPFHIYGVKQAYLWPYYGTGAVVHGSYPYTHLLNNLTRYDWGWVGPYPDEYPQWHSAMPNKMFEYLAAGIPVIVHKADECAAFVAKHNVGVIINSISELRDFYPSHYDCRKAVHEVRDEFVMENQVDVIQDVYERAYALKTGTN